MKTGVSDISFGEDLMPATAGGAYTLTGLIENKKVIKENISDKRTKI